MMAAITENASNIPKASKENPRSIKEMISALNAERLNNGHRIASSCHQGPALCVRQLMCLACGSGGLTDPNLREWLSQPMALPPTLTDKDNCKDLD